MTNPAAAYSPEGSGGVINLITKPTAVRPGAVTTGSIRANVGDGGRWNLGGSGSWQKDKLTLSGDLGTRHDLALQTFDRLRESLNAGGSVTQTTHQTQDIEGDSDVQFMRLGAEYRLNDQLQLTGELRGNLIENGGGGLETYDTRSSAGTPISLYTRDGDFNFEGDNIGVTGRILRKFDEQGHDWTTELRVDRNRGHFSLASQYDFALPAAPTVFEQLDNRNRLNLVGFTSAYVRPLSNGGKLRLGYELETRDAAFDNAASRGPSPTTLVQDPFVTNRFEVDQAIHAAYATWERPFGKLSAQFGLRLEYADIAVNQVTTGVTDGQDYFRAYPTLHMTYQLTEAQSLRGSYSKRIQRPFPFQLNPFISYQDPLNLRSGNPDLEPQETDSFEAMWQMRAGQTFYQATAYYRDTSGAFTDVVTDLGGGGAADSTREPRFAARHGGGTGGQWQAPLDPALQRQRQRLPAGDRRRGHSRRPGRLDDGGVGARQSELAADGRRLPADRRAVAGRHPAGAGHTGSWRNDQPGLSSQAEREAGLPSDGARPVGQFRRRHDF